MTLAAVFVEIEENEKEVVDKHGGIHRRLAVLTIDAIASVCCTVRGGAVVGGERVG